ncbi:MAG: TIM barrel protein [Acidobacteria bacterium]|nr:TIM barrel protein [Acidobacteriota bacterium]
MTNHGAVSRRTFLTLTAAAPVLAAARFDNPFFALCMDTHDEKKRNLAEQAQMLRELGYAGAGHLWFDNVAERLATLDHEGLKLFQIYMRVDLGPKAKEPYDPRLRQVLPLLKGRDIQLAALITGSRPSDPALDERAVAVLREIGDAAAPYGVKVALYPHQANWLETVEDTVRIAQKAGRANIGGMFNLCHWLKVGNETELKPLLRAALPHLLAVSINGSDRGAEIKAGTGKWIQPLDSGTFDMPGFLAELRQAGFRGPIGLQCYGIPGDAAIHLRRSMSAWRALKRRVETAS